MLFWLIAGHAIMDFWAQSDSVAKMKNRHNDPAKFCPPGQKPQAMWFYALSAHAVMHGAMVMVVTQSLTFGLGETVLHWLIDFGKCENWYGIHFDQFLHIWLKIMYWLIIIGFRL